MEGEEFLHDHLPTAKITLGCPNLDRFLQGGIPCNSVTELVAESGTGKTQLSLQLLLTTQLPLSHGGLSASSLYLHSEFPFPIRRLHQLSLTFRPRLAHNPLDRIFVQPLYSACHMLDLLPQLEVLVPRLGIKLIVIDSIAALFRADFNCSQVEMKRRSRLFFDISSRLKSYARKFGLALVLTNQVVDVMDSSDNMRVGNSHVLYSSGRKVSPALGLSWSNCVNTRLFLWREYERVREESFLEESTLQEGGERHKARRFARVVFAPHLPDSSCEFVIEREGVSGVQE